MKFSLEAGSGKPRQITLVHEKFDPQADCTMNQQPFHHQKRDLPLILIQDLQPSLSVHSITDYSSDA